MAYKKGSLLDLYKSKQEKIQKANVELQQQINASKEPGGLSVLTQRINKYAEPSPILTPSATPNILARKTVTPELVGPTQPTRVQNYPTLSRQVETTAGTTPTTTLKPVTQTPTATISQAEKQSLLQRVKDTAKRPFQLSDEDLKAKEGAIYSLQKHTGLSRDEVTKNYDSLTKKVGLRNQPTLEEIGNLAIGIGLGTGIAKATISTLKAIGTFAAIDETKKALLRKITDGKAENFADLLPENSANYLKDSAKLTEFLAEAYATSGALRGVSSAKDYFFPRRDVIIQELVDFETNAMLNRLGLKQGASKTQVSESYKNLAKQYHPDKPGGNEEKMKSINEAHTYLQKYYNPNKVKTIETPATTEQNQQQIEDLKELGLEWGASRSDVSRSFFKILSERDPSNSESNAYYRLMHSENKYNPYGETAKYMQAKAEETKTKFDKAIEDRYQKMKKGQDVISKVLEKNKEVIVPQERYALPTTKAVTTIASQEVSKNIQSLIDKLKTKIKGKNAPATQKIIESLETKKDSIGGDIYTPIKVAGKEGRVELLEKYKNKNIVRLGDGQIVVYDPKKETIFSVSLDDSKISGERKLIGEANTIENARNYIDYTTKSTVKPKEQKVNAGKNYREYVAEMKEKEEAKELSDAVKRVLGGRNRAELEKTARKTKAEDVVTEIRKDIVNTGTLEHKLAEMKRGGATENDFRNLEFEAFQDFMSGKTKEDKSIIISDYIDRNFGTGAERLYSKTTQSIDRAEPRQKIGTEKFKLFEKTHEMIKKYGNLVSEKNVNRRAVGVHYRDTSNIAVKSLNDVPTVAHELAHAIDKSFGITANILEKNDKYYIKKLSEVFSEYYGAKTGSKEKRVVEGFASLVEQYILNPEKITKEFPELVKNLFNENGRYYESKIGELIKDFNKIIEDYQALSDADKIAARVLSKNREITKEKIFNLEDKLITIFADYVRPMEKMAINNNVEFTDKDPSIYFRFRRQATNLALYNISNTNGFWVLDENFTPTKKLNYNMKTLGQELVKNGDYQLYTESYLVARRILSEMEELNSLAAKKGLNEYEKDRLEQLKTIRENESWDLEIIKNVVNSYKDKFAKYDEKFDSINNALVDMMIDTDFIDKKYGEELKARKGYAPMLRSIIDEFEGEEAGQYGIRKPSTVQATTISRKGSQKVILEPFTSVIKATLGLFDKVSLKRAYDNLYALKDKGGIQEIETQPLPMGNKIIYPKNNGTSLMFKHGDKMVTLKLTKELADVFITDIEMREKDTLRTVAKKISNFFVKSTTGALYPAFMFTNIFIDAPGAVAQSRTGLIPVADGIRYITEAKRNPNSLAAKTWKEFNAIGGQNNVQVEMYRETPEEIASKLFRGDKTADKLLSTENMFVRGFTAPSRYSEVVNRYGEYHRARMYGDSSPVAIEKSIRVTAAFAHRGTLGNKWLRAFFEMLPYGNAGLQVSNSTYRAFRDEETRPKATAVFLTLTTLNVAGLMYLIYRYNEAKKSGDKEKEDKYQAMINEYKNLTPYDIGNNLITTSISEKENLSKVRTPGNYSILGTLINMAISEKVLGADFSYKDYLDAVVQPYVVSQFNILHPVEMTASWLPPAARATLESGLNKKTFPNVADIEPSYMASWPSENKYLPYTNDLAIWLGQTDVMKEADISPLVIEHFLKTLLGRGVNDLTKNIGEGATGPLKSVMESIRGTVRSNPRRFTGTGYNKFYKDKEDIDNKYKEAKDIGDRIEMLKYAEPKKIYNNVSDTLADLRKINYASDEQIPIKYANRIFEVIDKLNSGNYQEARKIYFKNAGEINAFINKELTKIKVEERKKLQEKRLENQSK